MRTRSEIHDSFATRFHFGDRHEPADDRALDAIEVALDTKLPLAYRQFMLRCGALYMPSILDQVADRNLDPPDIREFFRPEAVIADTKIYWSGGMPTNVVGFASDSMGNMFGFRRRAETLEDSPVIFFDHDFVEVHDLFTSFDELLAWYLDNLKDPTK